MTNLPSSQCTGCSACLQVCPRNCISLEVDDKGFKYACVDHNECVKCGICEKICPTLNPLQEREIIKSFAVRNRNPQIVHQSSSGGAFTAFAEYIILSGGVVCGAAFDKRFNLRHIVVDTIDQLHTLRGSKYVQSETSTIYKQIRTLLDAGRLVLFVGTSCQVAGLKGYLRKDYDTLYAVDVVCHGVASPKVWTDYLSSLFSTDTIGDISQISFRDKRYGWRNFSLSIHLKRGSTLIRTVKEDPYLQCFVKNLTLRPNCFNCYFKSGKSGADLSIADLWGVANILPMLNDDKGVTSVLAYTNKGLELLNSLENIDAYEVNSELVILNNAAIMNSPMKPEEYDLFWTDYNLKGVRVLSEYKDALKKRDKIDLLDYLRLYIRRIRKLIFKI